MARALASCSAWAAISLPVPDSPVSNTVLSTAAFMRSAACRPRMTIERPTSASMPALRCDSVRRSTQFSRRSRARSRPWRSALSTWDTRKGFSRKSPAPARKASMAVSRSAKAVISTTSLASPWARISRSIARPLLPGIAMSRMTRSNRWRSSSCPASSAQLAASTWPTRGTRAFTRKLRIPGSSSTTSTAA